MLQRTAIFSSPTGFWNSWGRASLIPFTVVVFILAGAFPQFPGDEWGLVELQSLQSGWLTAISQFLAHLGSSVTAAVLCLLGITTLWLTNRRTESLVAMLGTILIVIGIALKLVVGRPRPDYFLIASTPGLPSFPSGHTLFATIFFGFAIVLIEEGVQRVWLRRSLQAGMALLILAMGASRVYLGFHWPSDVLGGFLYGGVALMELFWLRNRLGRKDRII